MNKNYMHELSNKITNIQIFDMLESAKKNITDWKKPSKFNIGLSRGIHWNLFCKDFKVENECSAIVKYRMIQEYNEFLPIELQPKKKEKIKINTVHQNPIF